MRCDYCELIEREKENEIIYQDVDVVVAVKDLVSAPGQITVFPKEHYTIMEAVPNKILKKCFQMANKVSIAVFESLGCQGTNIIVQNGHGADQTTPHFGIEIIPRREGDELNLEWEPKKLMEHEMDQIFTQIEPGCKKLGKIDGKEVKKKSKKDKKPKKEGVVILEDDKDEENYLLKSLRKTP